MGLPDKKTQILELKKQGKKNIEISKLVQVDPGYVTRIVKGVKTPEAKELTAETNLLNSQIKHIAAKKLFSWVKSLKPDDTSTKLRHKQLVDVINALSKAPSVSIQSYTMHLSGKEWENEFNRITALARATTLSRRVQPPERGGEDEVSPPNHTEDSGREGLQDTEVSTEP